MDSLLLVQVRFLPRMWQGKVANASLAQSAYEVYGSGPVRSFFDPQSGRREMMEVKPLSDSDQKLRSSYSGFSRYPTESRTCYQCGEKGHLSANCPQKVRRVSLTEGTIRYEGPSETSPRLRL